MKNVFLQSYHAYKVSIRSDFPNEKKYILRIILYCLNDPCGQHHFVENLCIYNDSIYTYNVSIRSGKWYPRKVDF